MFPESVSSERGVALVVVLVLSAAVLIIMTAMIYMITSGTQLSGLQKRYKTAQQAAEGGNDVFYQIIGNEGDTSPYSLASPPATPSTCSGTLSSGQTYTGFAAKLFTPSTTWSQSCKADLTTIDPNNTGTFPYDVKMTIGEYTYYAKIVETIDGNSASTKGSGMLYSGSVITGFQGVGAIPVVSQPYLYAIEAEAEKTSNPDERAKYSILYQY